MEMATAGEEKKRHVAAEKRKSDVSRPKEETEPTRVQSLAATMKDSKKKVQEYWRSLNREEKALVTAKWVTALVVVMAMFGLLFGLLHSLLSGLLSLLLEVFGDDVPPLHVIVLVVGGYLAWQRWKFGNRWREQTITKWKPKISGVQKHGWSSLAGTTSSLMEKLQDEWQYFEREEYVAIWTTYVTVLVLICFLEPLALCLALAGALFLAWRARKKISASLFSLLWDFLKRIARKMAALLAALVVTLIAGLVAVAAGIFVVMKKLFKKVFGLFKGIKKLFTKLFDKVKQFWDKLKLGKKLLDIAKLAASLVPPVTGAFGLLAGLLGGLLGGLGTLGGLLSGLGLLPALLTGLLGLLGVGCAVAACSSSKSRKLDDRCSKETITQRTAPKVTEGTQGTEPKVTEVLSQDWSSLADTIRNLMEKLQEDWQNFEREEHVAISITYVAVLVLVLLLKPNAIYLALAGVFYLAWRARERISASFLRAVDASKLQMEMEKKKKESLATRSFNGIKNYFIKKITDVIKDVVKEVQEYWNSLNPEDKVAKAAILATVLVSVVAVFVLLFRLLSRLLSVFGVGVPSLRVIVLVVGGYLAWQRWNFGDRWLEETITKWTTPKTGDVLKQGWPRLASIMSNLRENLRQDWHVFKQEEYAAICTTCAIVLALICLLEPIAIYLALAGMMFLAWRRWKIGTRCSSVS